MFVCLSTEDAGTYFPSVKRDPGRYLQPCSDSVKTWLRSMKSAGKVLLLITSSHKQQAAGSFLLFITPFPCSPAVSLAAPHPHPLPSCVCDLLHCAAYVASRAEQSDPQLKATTCDSQLSEVAQRGQSCLTRGSWPIPQTLLLPDRAKNPLPLCKISLNLPQLHSKRHLILMLILEVCTGRSSLLECSPHLDCLPAMNDVEESEGLPALDKPGWYSQGNWPHLHEL
ncbi:hypothetical protein FQN60_015793, partial [Etheostoma spectabile]